MADFAQVNNIPSYNLLGDEIQEIESFINEILEKEKAEENLDHYHNNPNQYYNVVSQEYQQNNNYNYLGEMQMKQELHGASLESSDSDESIQLEELETFVRTFKPRRIRLGFTQGDVGIALGKLYGNDFSQTTISRFEALSLSYKNMCKLKPLLQNWLDEATKSLSNPDSFFNPNHKFHPLNVRRRKKRSSIESRSRQVLERQFKFNQKPTSEDLDLIAELTGLSKSVVRIWFSNRRQKARRLGGDSISSSINYECSSTFIQPMQNSPLGVLNYNSYYVQPPPPPPQPIILPPPPQYQYPPQYQQNIYLPSMYNPHPHVQYGVSAY